MGQGDSLPSTGARVGGGVSRTTAERRKCSRSERKRKNYPETGSEKGAPGRGKSMRKCPEEALMAPQTWATVANRPLKVSLDLILQEWKDPGDPELGWGLITLSFRKTL